jgi:hypothetical protein
MQIVAPVQPLLQSQPERVKFHRGSDHTLYTQAAMICCEKMAHPTGRAECACEHGGTAGGSYLA